MGVDTAQTIAGASLATGSLESEVSDHELAHSAVHLNYVKLAGSITHWNVACGTCGAKKGARINLTITTRYWTLNTFLSKDSSRSFRNLIEISSITSKFWLAAFNSIDVTIIDTFKTYFFEAGTAYASSTCIHTIGTLLVPLVLAKVWKWSGVVVFTFSHTILAIIDVAS